MLLFSIYIVVFQENILYTNMSARVWRKEIDYTIEKYA